MGQLGSPLLQESRGPAGTHPHPPAPNTWLPSAEAKGQGERLVGWGPEGNLLTPEIPPACPEAPGEAP